VRIEQMLRRHRRIPGMKALCAALGAIAWTPPASAQGRATEEPPSHAAKLATLLNPADYDPAVYLGAQAEFATPKTGATSLSSLVVGYDAIILHVDLSLGLGLGGDALLDEASTQAFAASLRLGVPIHRGIRADFSLIAAGGVLLLDAPDGDTATVGEAGGGGRFRVFMTPNVAVIASVGLIALFRGDNSSLFVGARPLGAAAVVYFFR
jgi:hypothetical protein